MTHLIERFTEYLKTGKYNSSTIAAYRNAIFVFHNHFWNLPQSKVSDDLVGTYLKDLADKKDPQEVIQAGKAIKLFYEVIFNKVLNIKATGESKNDKLPVVLNKEEVRRIFQAVKNIKHKALLLLIYNSGLRISEVLTIKVSHLNFEERNITLIGDQDKPDRTLRVAPNSLDFIRRYMRKHNPTDLLFPGEKGNPYSSRNVQLFFRAALKNSGVKKDATVHTLRHSFAVHSLEAGMDIHILQEILGHKFLQTTSLYNQMINLRMDELRSPLEDIDLSVGEIKFPF
ncbi:Site-specific recombinase XerD [Spirosomataceae bacterium TFI 002]|nr:Site-specific recombinase XerD [Spirosomataceae bacterium TFI 002]